MKKDERKKIAVRAIAEGFFGGARRRKGSTFFVPEGVTGKWFVPTDPSLAAVNASALEEASRTKAKAAEKARQDLLKAEQDLKDKKAETAAELQAAGRVADDEAKKKIFGGLYTQRVAAPGAGDVDGGEGDASDKGNTDDLV